MRPINVGRAAAHVDGDPDGLQDLVARSAMLDRGRGVEADAAVAGEGGELCPIQGNRR